MEGEAIGLVSLARIPTVTKPCLKSIFAGTRPVFFEIVENIDESGVSGTVSTGTSQDNLLQRLSGKGRRMAVYGDDVWGKLFPMGLFHRHGLSFGFNIMDFTEVDELVHAGFEGEKNAEVGSDVIILHYLGLDHLGHSYAAKDEYVRPKLKEMDGKIEEVCEWVRGRDAQDGRKTLILMMGDHGMTPEGNHGGGSKEEAQAAAVFMSPHFKKSPAKESWREAIEEAEFDAHNQEDLAATLTALLDGSSPLKFGNGCLIERVMRSVDDFDLERTQLLKNLKHLIEKLGPEKCPEIQDFKAENVYKVSEEIKGKLNANTFEFDEGKLQGAVMGLAVIAVAHVVIRLRGVKGFDLESIVALISLAILTVCQEATSFIGEEHLIWQGAFLATFLASLLRSKALWSGIKVMALHRLLCGWNGIGLMWVNEKTVGSLVKSNGRLEAALVAASLLWILYRRFGKDRSGIKRYVLASLLVFIHKALFPNYLLAQVVLLILISDLLISRTPSINTATAAISFVLLNKPANAMPIALILELVESINSLDTEISAFMKLCTMQCAFYSLGLWNSVSAIDLTFGAVFSKRFDMRVAPFVLLIYTLSGPILVAIAFKKRPGDQEMMWLMRSILDLGACAFAYKHRFHPWVFDFFSPKILFQVIWTAFYCLLLPVIEVGKETLAVKL